MSAGDMTVRELIEIFNGLDPDTIVVQAKNHGGSGYSPTASYSVGYYRPDSTWSGSFHQPLDDEDRATGLYSEEDEYEPDDGDVPAVLLWPTN